MLEVIIEIWPAILAIGGATVAIGTFVKLLLEIRRLQLQIQSLQKEVEDSKTLIHRATDEETRRYSELVRRIETRAERYLISKDDSSDRQVVALLNKLDRFVDEQESRMARLEAYNRRKDLQQAYRPEGIQLAILSLYAKQDSVQLTTVEIRSRLPELSRLEILGALGEMADVGLFGSWSSDSDGEGCYRLSAFGTKIVAEHKTSELRGSSAGV